MGNIPIYFTIEYVTYMGMNSRNFTPCSPFIFPQTTFRGLQVQYNIRTKIIHY